MKKSLGKRLVSKLLVPVTKKYLQKDRNTQFMNMDLHVPSGVFHPALFFSTKSMCKFLLTLPLKNKKLMEVGCGSGAVSIHAAKLGANVFACDINPLAVTTTQENAEKNQVSISAIESNLFDSVSEKDFDYIINNPPYYPKDPRNMEERAWYAGRNHDYFKLFFNQCLKHLKPDGTIYMVLSKEANPDLICKIANENSFNAQYQNIEHHWLEKSFILSFTIRYNS